VRSFSSAWFKLIEALPELREAFALGDKVVVVGKSVVIETGDDGLESIDDASLQKIKDRWQ
jgi:hypothetical protein